jgi:hypothetical protein
MSVNPSNSRHPKKNPNTPFGWELDGKPLRPGSNVTLFSYIYGPTEPPRKYSAYIDRIGGDLMVSNRSHTTPKYLSEDLELEWES